MILDRASLYASPDFEPGAVARESLETAKILVAGAGGLGCELLKDLVKLGFRDIEIIDMDTIDISNLNRQFLFTDSDVGQPKAEVAARYVLGRMAHATDLRIKAHYAKLQDFSVDCYAQFSCIISGLDSVEARRFLNGVIYGLLRYDADGKLDMSSVVPMIDGGSEGFKGNVRLTYPGFTACLECNIQTFPKQTVYPLCTLASTPRLPEHCVEYARLLLWTKAFPTAAFDADDPEHLSWVYEQALARAEAHGIVGVTYRFTLGVVKNIIPAVASTNAIVAGVCANEAFKLLSHRAPTFINYLFYNGEHGIYSMVYAQEPDPNCACCQHNRPLQLQFSPESLLSDLISRIRTEKSVPTDTQLSLRTPGKSLYLSSPVSLEEQTRPNLAKPLGSLLACLDNADDPAPPSTNLSVTFNDASMAPLTVHLRLAYSPSLHE